MTAPRAEKAYEKYAWIIFFVVGVLTTIGGVLILVQFALLPQPELEARLPGIKIFVGKFGREIAILQLGWGILITAIARVSYRHGERWAWYVLWTVPLIYLAAIANNASVGQFDRFAIPPTILALLGLLLPYRKFFPRKQPAEV